MRKFALIFLIASTVAPAYAAKRVSVDQLDQAVTAGHARPDAEFAHQLADLELTERLNSAALARLQAQLPGESSRQALIALADASAFLPPPVATVPSRPAPAIADQRRMLALTVAYVSKTLQQLPNFSATRSTTRFEDTPQLQKDDFFVPYQPLHRVGASSVTVLYRDGQEAVDTGSSKRPPPMTEGLITRGAFGPILGTVLLDAAQSKLAWSRWEQGPLEPQGVSVQEAVFSYSVPKEKSHYEVAYCCVASEAATAVADMHPFRRIVSYHGEISIDPATGTILRVLVDADLKSGDPLTRAAILVEYGPVEIGGKNYVCPLKSISTATAQTVQLDPLYKFPLANQLQPLKRSLSDIAFSDFHVFRAEARVLSADIPDRDQPKPTLASATSAVSSLAPMPIPAPTPSETATAAIAPPQPAPEPNAPPLPAPEPAVSEITVAEAPALPDVSPNSHTSVPDNGFTLHTTARLVDLGVVAYDKNGHPITDLKPEDFALYDNGRKQKIRFFSQAARESAPSHPSDAVSASASPAQPEYSNHRIPAPEGKEPASDTNQTILLIDAANLAWSDLSYARSEMLRFLNSVSPTERVGLYIMHGYSFEVLQEPITGHAQLAAMLSHWTPAAQDLSRAQDEEQRNRQQFEWVHNIEDLKSVNGNTNDRENPGLQPKFPTDPKLLIMGSNPGRDALFILTSVARHLAAIPGHKSLVWVSSDNVLADWSNQAAARQDKGSKIIEPLALRTQEALNDSHASIYPLDASQLEAGGIAADLGTRNVLVMGYSDRDQHLASLPTDAVPGMKAGRITAQMQQDTRPIQGVFRDLADATGGRVFRRSGSIANELDGVVNDGRAAWLLSFTPDQPADDKYHQLTLKLTSRRDATLRYRTGYQYDKEPVTLKDRFRQAIWRPADASEIALTAHPEAAAKGAMLMLNIAATDLDLAQKGNRITGRIYVFLVERDDSGLHAQITGQALGLNLKPETFQRLLRDGVPFEVQVETHPEVSSVRIVIVDQNSGRMGSVTIPTPALVWKK